MTVIQRDIVVRTSCTCFAAADKSFNGENITCIHVTIFLFAKEFADFCIFFIDDLICTVIKQLIETIDKMQETDHFFVANSNITACFVGYMNVVSLFYQTAQRTTHRDNIVVRMG